MRRKILLADDSPTIQRLVTQTFADSDFDIISVSNGEAALRKFEDLHPHIVLADIYMPGKNGYEVCAHVKSHATLAATPVILLVGAFDAFDEQTAASAGAVASITKPFEPGALVELVMSVLKTQPAVETPAGADSNDAGGTAPNEDDLLGLEVLFKEQPPEPVQTETALSEAEIDRIADRVIQKLSSQVVESIAWEIVPDITEKVLREELKRNR